MPLVHYIPYMNMFQSILAVHSNMITWQVPSFHIVLPRLCVQLFFAFGDCHFPGCVLAFNIWPHTRERYLQRVRFAFWLQMLRSYVEAVKSGEKTRHTCVTSLPSFIMFHALVHCMGVYGWICWYVWNIWFEMVILVFLQTARLSGFSLPERTTKQEASPNMNQVSGVRYVHAGFGILHMMCSCLCDVMPMSF